MPSLGPYGQALDFQQVARSQITPCRQRVPQAVHVRSQATVRVLAYALNRMVAASTSTSKVANSSPAPLQTLEAPRKTHNLAERVLQDFPILQQQVNGKRLVYLDNAATSQKPAQVRQAMEDYYGPAGYNSNVHRGVHFLSSKATAAYEQARDKIARFIHARTSREIVFVKNASEGINLVALTWGTKNIKKGDEVRYVLLLHHGRLACRHCSVSSQVQAAFIVDCEQSESKALIGPRPVSVYVWSMPRLCTDTASAVRIHMPVQNSGSSDCPANADHPVSCRAS